MCMCIYSFLVIIFFFFKQKTAYEMRISDWSSDVCSSDLPLAPHLDVGFIQAPARIKATPPEPAQPLLHLRGVALDPAIDRRMVDRNAAFRQHFLKVAIADRIATIPAHRPQDHITLEMAPLEIRHRSVRPISAKH